MTRPIPACAGIATAAYDPFFDPHAGATVARICASCPVLGRCFVGALRRGEADGWWSGEWFGPDLADPMVVAEPRARIRPTVSAVHGNRGTYLHCTAGEDGGKCSDCKRANASYQAGYRDHGPVTTRETIDLFEQMTIGA